MESNLSPDSTSRRQWVVAAAASATLILPMHQADTRANADVTVGWLQMVKGHHEAIARSFDALLDTSEAARQRREPLLRSLAFQMSAHSLAEENTIYPALALNGLLNESDRLYLEQAHFKVRLAMLQAVEAQEREASAQWLGAVRQLRDVVLAHARNDEEEVLFPRLALQLGDRANQELALAYDREYGQLRGVAANRFS